MKGTFCLAVSCQVCSRDGGSATHLKDVFANPGHAGGVEDHGEQGNRAEGATLDSAARPELLALQRIQPVQDRGFS